MTQRLTWYGRKPWPPASTAIVASSPAERVRHYADAAIPASTRRAYNTQFRLFRLWCGGKGYSSQPATPATVAEYITGMADDGSSPATIDVALAAIGKAHEIAGEPNPRESIEVRTVRKGIRRKKRTASEGRAPLTLKQIRKIALDDAHCPVVLWDRDMALLLTGIAGALRRSELAALNLEDVRFTPLGVELKIRSSKTDQEGAGELVGLPLGTGTTCPVQALTEWVNQLTKQLKRRPSPDAALFRSVSKYGVIGGRLPAAEVGRIVKKHVERIGDDPAPYGAHSLRRTFVTLAVAAGKSDAAIMRQTRHRTREMVDVYAKGVRLFDDNAAEGIGL